MKALLLLMLSLGAHAAPEPLEEYYFTCRVREFTDGRYFTGKVTFVENAQEGTVDLTHHGAWGHAMETFEDLRAFRYGWMLDRLLIKLDQGGFLLIDGFFDPEQREKILTGSYLLDDLSSQVRCYAERMDHGVDESTP